MIEISSFIIYTNFKKVSSSQNKYKKIYHINWVPLIITVKQNSLKFLYSLTMLFIFIP